MASAAVNTEFCVISAVNTEFCVILEYLLVMMVSALKKIERSQNLEKPVHLVLWNRTFCD